MAEPAYVAIAGEYARRIRNRDLSPGTKLPSYADLAARHGVSDIVVRKAIELLQNQGLVRSVRRKGVFIANRPNLVRVSPERQMENAETTFGNESVRSVHVDREAEEVSATDELAELFNLMPGDNVTHVITRASDDSQPISISDTYQPLGVTGISTATVLEETLADRIPTETHAVWLQVTPGELVKTVHQRFIADDGRVVMVSDVSYPRDRYEAFVFRMSLTTDTTQR